MMVKKCFVLILALSNSFAVYANDTSRLPWGDQILKIQNEVESNPNDLKVLVKAIIAYNNYAQMLLRKEDYKEAIKYFNKALDIAPEQKYIKTNASNACLSWAKVEFAAGHNYRAASLSDSALMYDPENSDAQSLSTQIASKMVSNDANQGSTNTSAPASSSNVKTMPVTQSQIVPVSSIPIPVSNASQPASQSVTQTPSGPPTTPKLDFSAVSSQINDFMRQHGATQSASEQDIQEYSNSVNGIPSVTQINEFIKRFGGTAKATQYEVNNFIKQNSSAVSNQK